MEDAVKTKAAPEGAASPLFVTLDQPAFSRKRLKAEKLIDSKVLEQLIRVRVDADKLL